MAKTQSMIAPGANEYEVKGRDYITIDAAWARKHSNPEEIKREAERLASLRRIADGIFLNNYLNDKEDGDGNFGYGGFNAEVRYSKDQNPRLQPDDRDPNKFWFDYSMIVGGYSNLISLIKDDPYQKLHPLGRNEFSYAAAILDNTTLARIKPGQEWYRDEAWGFWSPTNNPKKAEVSDLKVTIVPKPAESDAYLPLDQLIVTERDGSLHIPIAVHFGWDGESQGADIPEGGIRYDVELARNLFKKLTRKLGFKAPAPDFESYNPFLPSTPPFRKTIKINGKPVSVDLTVYAAGQVSPMKSDSANGMATKANAAFKRIPGPDPETAAGASQARNQAIQSFANKKIVLYLGHSGLGMGFNFGNWFVPEVGDKGTLYAKDVAKLKMMDSYQLVIADGCQTYYLAESFLENQMKRDPDKRGQLKNLNLITSLGFTDADSTRTVTQLLQALTREDNGRAVAPRVSDILSRYNPDGVPFRKFMQLDQQPRLTGSEVDEDDEDDDPLFPVYGMHGIENNPRSNPLANRVSFGKACVEPSACGSGDGNICRDTCTFECINDSGCSDLSGGSAICQSSSSGSTVVPTLGVCLSNKKVQSF